jgi:hypothetical protein
MHPAPKVMADRTRKKSAKHNLNLIGAQCLVSIAYWRRGTSVRQYIGALILASRGGFESFRNSSVPLAYWHANRLLSRLYLTEKEIR